MLKRNVVLWMMLGSLLLTPMAGCQREESTVTDSSAMAVVSEDSSLPEEVSSLEPVSSAEPVSSKGTSSEAQPVSSQESSVQPESIAQSISLQASQVESRETSSSIQVKEDQYNMVAYSIIYLTFKPECITTKEEMTNLSFFPELDEEYIDYIEWNDDSRYEYTLGIYFKPSINDEKRQIFRTTLLERDDLLKMSYGQRYYITDPF